MSNLDTSYINLLNDIKILDDLPKVIINLHSNFSSRIFEGQPYVRFLGRGNSKFLNILNYRQQQLEQKTGFVFDSTEFDELVEQQDYSKLIELIGSDLIGKEIVWKTVNEFHKIQSLAHLLAYQEILNDTTIDDSQWVLVVENDVHFSDDWPKYLSEVVWVLVNNASQFEELSVVSLTHSKNTKLSPQNDLDLQYLDIPATYNISIHNKSKPFTTLYYLNYNNSQDLGCYLIRKGKLKKSLVANQEQILKYPTYFYTNVIENFAFDSGIVYLPGLALSLNSDNMDVIGFDKQTTGSRLSPQDYQWGLEKSFLSSHQNHYDYLKAVRKFYIYQNNRELGAFYHNQDVEDFEIVKMLDFKHMSPEQREQLKTYPSYNLKQRHDPGVISWALTIRELYAQILLDQSIGENDWVLIANSGVKFAPDWRVRIQAILKSMSLNKARFVDFIILGFEDLEHSIKLDDEVYKRNGALFNNELIFSLSKEIGAYERRQSYLNDLSKKLANNRELFAQSQFTVNKISKQQTQIRQMLDSSFAQPDIIQERLNEQLQQLSQQEQHEFTKQEQLNQAYDALLQQMSYESVEQYLEQNSHDLELLYLDGWKQMDISAFLIRKSVIRHNSQILLGQKPLEDMNAQLLEFKNLIYGCHSVVRPLLSSYDEHYRAYQLQTQVNQQLFKTNSEICKAHGLYHTYAHMLFEKKFEELLDELKLQYPDLVDTTQYFSVDMTVVKYNSELKQEFAQRLITYALEQLEHTALANLNLNAQQKQSFVEELVEDYLNQCNKPLVERPRDKLRDSLLVNSKLVFDEQHYQPLAYKSAKELNQVDMASIAYQNYLVEQEKLKVHKQLAQPAKEKRQRQKQKINKYLLN